MFFDGTFFSSLFIRLHYRLKLNIKNIPLCRHSFTVCRKMRNILTACRHNIKVEKHCSMAWTPRALLLQCTGEGGEGIYPPPHVSGTFCI